MFIRQIEIALNLTSSIISFVKYSTFTVIVVEKDRLSEPESSANNAFSSSALVSMMKQVMCGTTWATL